MCELIVSLDLLEEKSLKKIVEETEEYADWFKIGIVPFLKFGPHIIEYLKNKKKKIFLDLKFFDIPNTVLNASKIAFDYDVEMFNIHLLGGEKMIDEVLNEKAKSKNKCKIIGVTILTSFSGNDIERLGIKRSLKEEIIFLASLGYEKKIDGIVCSVEDLKFLRTIFTKPFIMVCPGIRVSPASDDQKRIGTVKESVALGADYIVVGRPVIESSDPGKTVKQIISELK